MYKVRRANKSDIGIILKIDYEAFNPDAYPYLFFRQALELYNATFLVAVSGSEVVGYCLGAPNPQDPFKAWILSIAVKKIHRGENIGAQLLTDLLNTLQQNGKRQIYLSVRPDNVFARKLFKKYHFHVLRKDDNYAGANDPRLIMRLDILV